MRVSVVVPAHGAEATIGAALDALARQDLDAPYEVIVVDDGSTDATVRIAAAAPGPVRVLRQERGGAAAARNRGVAAAAAPIIAFTDADCVPAPGWLRAAVEVIDGGADVVQGRIEPPPGERVWPWDHTLWRVERGPWFETANLVVRRELFDRAGGFEALFEDADGRPIGEDTWFGWRLRRLGAVVVFDADALVRHAVIHGSPAAHIAEQRRRRHFPELARRIPELRAEACFAHVFLSRRTASLDAALAGVALAVATRSRAPLAAGVPYAVLVGREALRWRLWAPVIAASAVATDLAGAAALVEGSVRSRAPVL